MQLVSYYCSTIHLNATFMLLFVLKKVKVNVLNYIFVLLVLI